LRVFEVDHPATQSAKRTRLADAGIDIPDTATFIGVDFATARLVDALRDGGFDASAPAFCSWLGVVVYLDLPAIEETLRTIASLPAGTAILFDYGVPPASLGLRSRVVVEEMARRVAAVGEPWKTYLSPDDVRRLALRVGFGAVDDFGADDLSARYLAGRTDLRLGEAGRIAVARVQR
jgi:methyltransferase (TIGR00027 family)